MGRPARVRSGRHEIEFWTKTTGKTLHVAVRADTKNWIAVLFKDFPDHGMIGDFGDVKLLSPGGIQDAYLSDGPEEPPYRKAGRHT